MKKIAPNKIKLVFIAFSAVITLPLVLFIFFPTLLLAFTHSSLFFLFFSIFLLLSRAGKIRLSDTTLHPVYPMTQWFLMILGAEIFLNILFFSFIHTASTYIPGENIIITPGLHPWPMIAMLAVMLGFIYFNEKKLPIFSSFIPILQNTDFDIMLKRIIQIALNASTLISLAISVSFGALQLAALLSNALHLPHLVGIQLTTVLLSCLILSVLLSRSCSQVIRFLCRQSISVGLFLFGFLLLLGLIFTLANALTSHASIILEPIPLSPIAWQIIGWIWWIGWVPFISSFIARISAGKSIRVMILAILCLPLILNFTSVPTIPPFLGDIISLLGPLLLISLFLRAHDSALLVLGFMPNPPKNIFAKPRRTIQFIRLLLLGIATISIAYIGLGLKLILLIMMVSWSAFLFYIVLSFLFYKRMF